MGISLKVLLDKHERFLPAALSDFYLDTYCEARSSKQPVHHLESEVIWQAVSASTWNELCVYIRAVMARYDEETTRLGRTWSYNLLSANVRKQWKEALYYDDFIRGFNSKHPKLDPPLRISDNLAIRLGPFGGLRSGQEDRVIYNQEFASPYLFHPGNLTPWEEAHFKKRGIRFDAVPDFKFENTIDIRAAKHTALLGLPDLIEPTIARCRMREEDGGVDEALLQEGDVRKCVCL
ncbi:BZ3500_MvSof-1268-A1-R1_Chr6-3g08839 [Microbotryum saponariae]|uniref:BZ3500_MvSof-1268-A1-R1_Chr6-3g08839 protein n=1 Tax=Microbotryum saponariae TaxID=289078 RepID=A0A2X0MP95_9BASI|nr:BZ3500_MvSof-1268-A1-R1_Chr6-3g08839 [Microbotryum saponariae]SDA07440.1 BZ3501_MvSof-1269-A2-R1_Chr6-2g08542 [Microbotryum saponariae]